jgi:hypothetical protein
MRNNKNAKLKRAETIISKIVDLQTICSGWSNTDLQSAARHIRAFINQIENSHNGTK